MRLLPNIAEIALPNLLGISAPVHLCIDCSSLMPAHLPAEAGCEPCGRIFLLLIFVA